MFYISLCPQSLVQAALKKWAVEFLLSLIKSIKSICLVRWGAPFGLPDFDFFGQGQIIAKAMIKHVRIWQAEVMSWNSQVVTVIVLLKNVLLVSDDGFLWFGVFFNKISLLWKIGVGSCAIFAKDQPEFCSFTPKCDIPVFHLLQPSQYHQD